MCKVDLHIHSTFSDGKHSPEEIVISAIDMGLEKVGISDHSFTLFDQSYCVKCNEITQYQACISKLKQKYSDKIDILCGIEQDYYSDTDISQYDYVIGSVHYVNVNDQYIPVDESPEILLESVNKYFNGNIYAFIDLYYQTVSDVVNKTNADIIGHIDLISKFNENNILFDEKDKRYIKAYQNACDKLLESGRLFEINTGAISRGYRTTPYPSNDVYHYLKTHGAKFVLSSDSHSKDNLCYKFDDYINLI